MVWRIRKPGLDQLLDFQGKVFMYKNEIFLLSINDAYYNNIQLFNVTIGICSIIITSF